MRSCFARIGCLAVVVVLVLSAYVTRDRWWSRVRGATIGGSSALVWEPLTREGAARARVALTALSRPTGPVYANLSAGDIASYVFESLSKVLPPSADSVAATIIDDRLYIRASVRLAELGGSGTLGPLAGMLGDRERMQFGGTFDVVRPGLAEYRVRDIRIRDFALPSAMIPRLLAQIERGSRPESLAPDGLPLVIPTYLGDVRIGARSVTLYRTTPR